MIEIEWSSIVLSLITAGALAFCRWSWKQVKNYKEILKEKESQGTIIAIDEKIQPIEDEIEELRAYIRTLDKEDNRKFNLIISSYRFRLVQLCRIYLQQGYMTSSQYEQLSEFFNLYESLGGNGQAKEFYERALKLPIHEHNE